MKKLLQFNLFVKEFLPYTDFQINFFLAKLKQITKNTKAKLFQEAPFFHHHFYLPEVNMQVQNGNEVLRRIVLCI